ncbi:MFS general substrate transporter [Coniochaeta ligniaria NRRL 30616]|uniref:MFS general substrate transporter n=1 Tax=Coniochaeta ligniaria NRRL 30616 TaxID=1408157 RepID=A0A1J7J135_9PEZI|nr:MFS general substrate transporter [Coniochaeta ligniaria NRRL 30616]
MSSTNSEAKKAAQVEPESSPRGSFVDIIDPEVEKRLVRKLDLNIIPLIMVMQMISFLDRSNIGNAKVHGLVTDLGLKGSDFNVAASVFYVTYIAFEVPFNIVLQRFVPTIIISLSLVTIFTGFVQNYGGLLATRLMLGLCEAGLFPGLNYYLSTIYTRDEYAKRVCMLLVATALSGAFGGLIAYGVLQMDGVSGVAGWRWLFYIEGIMSFIVGICAIFGMPSTTEQAWFLNSEEKHVAHLRNLQRAETEDDGTIKWDEVREAFASPMCWLSGLIQFGGDICLFSFSIFLPTIIQGMGYTNLKIQYLTVPIYLWGAVIYIVVVLSMDLINHHRRSTYILIFGLFTVVGYVLLIASRTVGVLYFACYLCTTGLYILTGLNITWIGSNVKGRYKRAVAIGMNQTMGNAGGIIAGQIYITSDAPRYIIGQSVSLAAILLALAATAALFMVFRYQNVNKAKKLADGVEDEDEAKASDRSIHFQYFL